MIHFSILIAKGNTKLKEETLKLYFEDKIEINILSDDIKDSQKKTSYDTTTVYIDSFEDDEEFLVTTKHLLKLCNDAINNYLTFEDLNFIAFAIISSDYFCFDSDTIEGNIVSQTLFDWDSPEIQWPINLRNLQLWKTFLEGGEYELEKYNKPFSGKVPLNIVIRNF